ncbi:MAG: hypothetical protein PHO70_01560 [Candidatus Omnitrophica bacterium]|nr:hypothetical protein [Candidatus Omnitrophota bacterium]
MCTNFELRQLLKWGAVKYVYVNKENKFFLFNSPGKKIMSKHAVATSAGEYQEHISYHCAIFTGSKIIYPYDKKAIRYFLDAYGKKIIASPEFLINNVMNADLVINSPKYLKPIKDLLRQIGVLKETRGKIKKTDETTKILRAFIVKEFKGIQKKRPLPINILSDRLTKKVDSMFPDDSETAEKYYWSFATIRRIIKDCNKK